MTRSLRNFASRSVATRLMFGTALIVVLAFGVTALVTYVRSSRSLMDSAQQSMQNLARFEAQQIAGDLERAFSTNETLRDSFLSQRAQGGLDRATASAVIRQQLVSHPEWMGVGTIWEPQAFDGKDADNVATAGHDATGRFMSYWAWSNGEPMQEALRDYEVPGNGDWYLLPRQLRQPVVLEPYEYEIGGRKVLMTTLATPILEDGRFVGAMTVDFALESLQKSIAKLRPMEQGYARLLSPAGTVIADRDPGKVGRKLEDADTRAVLASIAKGTPVFRESHEAGQDEDMVEAYVPLQIGQAAQRFALGVVVPRSLLMQQAHSLLLTIMLVGLLASTVLCVALFLLIRRQVTKPLAEAVRISDAIAEGRLDNRIAQDREDELGQLQGAMRRMQSQIHALIAARGTKSTRRHEEGTISYRMDESVVSGRVRPDGARHQRADWRTHTR